MTPPAAPTLHPNRCETCKKYHEQPHPAYEGNILCYCGEERTQIETRAITARVGCYSHSSTPDADARQRIEDVIGKLNRASHIVHERVMEDNRDCVDRLIDAVGEIESAIALLKDGGGK